MGSTIQSRSNNISINYDGMKNELNSGVNVINTFSVGNYDVNVTEDYDFEAASVSLVEYTTIQLDSQTVELYLEGFLAKKNELQAKLEEATSYDEILQLQKQIFMIDFNIYMLNNQKKLYMYKDILNSEEYKNYVATGSISMENLYLIESEFNGKELINWDQDSKWMYCYIFETQGKDAANEYYNVILDVVNRQEGLSAADGMISLTNNSAEVAHSFMPNASEIFNNGGVLTSKEYAEMYALMYHTKMEGTYETTINEMNQLLMSGISINNSSNNDVSDGVEVFYNGEGLMTPVNFTTLSSPYGYRIHPITGERKFHNGVDLAAPEGTPIYAPMDGVVADSYYDSTYGGGNSVIIKHDGGYQTGYAHMAEYIVSPGQEVKQGQCIGYVGNTGASTGPHLHFTVRLNGNRVNPEEHINLGWKPGDDGMVGLDGQNSYNINNELEQSDINVEAIIPLVNWDSQSSHNINTELEHSNINAETIIPLVNSESQSSHNIYTELDQPVVGEVPTNSGVSHTVSSGDTLFTIAQKYYGDGNRYLEIAAANNISNPNKIYQGQELLIPSLSNNNNIEQSNISVETITPVVNSDNQSSYNINNGLEQVVTTEIPTVSSGVSHTVSRGDSLYAIAKRYYGDGNRYAEIAAANNISDPSKIYVGQELIIP